MHKHLLTILSLSQVFCLISAQTTIAVIDFDGRGISADEVATLTDRFRDELIKTNQFIVIERGKMEEVLKEQGFQQSMCTSDECVVEVGQLIGVQQMVGGNIGKVGNVYSVSVRIIDVKAGEIINVTTFDHTGDIGGLLTVGMRNTVQQLLEGKSKRYSLVEREIVKSNEYMSPPASKHTGTVTDIDGNTYQTIKIGNQRWMAENLKVTHYRNGDAIPNLTANGGWTSTFSGAYCAYNNNENNANTYGYLYNWYAVNDNRNIAPSGWHVSTDDEWQTLIDNLGGSSVAGGKLKETGTTHWYSPNTGATNESDFTVLPGGYRYSADGNYYHLGNHGAFWSSTGNNSRNAWYRRLHYNYSNVYRYFNYKQNGFSIRCVRD